MKFWALLLFPAIGIASATTSLQCNADNCLRAIRASAIPTQPGTADCSSYFRTTVTPATTTITETLTFTTTPTHISPITATVVIDVVATSAVDETATETDLETTTVAAVKAKRQVTVEPSSIPTYASACSGSVRYSSACSCIGVTATTITVATPSTTKTVSTTVTPTVVTLYTTLQTQTVVTTDSTVIVTTTDATAAVTSVSTVTANPPSTFELVASSGSYSGQYAYLSESGVIFFTSDPTEAATFAFSASGILQDADGVDAYFYSSYSNSYAPIAFQSDDIPGLSALQCTISATSELSCINGAFSVLAVCGDLAILPTDSAEYTTDNYGCDPITLSVVGVP